MIFFIGIFHEELRNETGEMDFGVSLQVKIRLRVGASVVCRPRPSLPRPTTLAPARGSRCLPDTFSGLRRSTRICPRDSEAACRQGKDKTPLFRGNFGRWNYFIPERIKSVSVGLLGAADPVAVTLRDGPQRPCRGTPVIF